MELFIYFSLTLFFSTLFSMGGIGSAIVLVSIFPLTGMPLNLAKALGLFINAVSTFSGSILNFLRRDLDLSFALPLVISTLISTPIGAYLSQYIAEYWVKWVLITLLLLSASLLLVQKKQAKVHYTRKWILYYIGTCVGLISGLLGVSGGSIIVPSLIFLGYEPKKAAYTVSFVIPFSALGGFFTYLHFVQMNWLLLLVVTIAALLGGIIGNRIMHYRLSQKQVKQLLAIVLYLLAVKLTINQF